MNKLSFYLVMVSISFTGCQKLLDYYNLQGNVDVPKSRVSLIKKNGYVNGTFQTSIHSVQYNGAGYPELVVEIYSAGLPGEPDQDLNQHLYDEQNRLIQEGAFTRQSPYRYRYVYEGDSPMPVRDTLYLRDNVHVEDFTYDLQGRIIRVRRRLIHRPNENSPFEQDQDLRYYYDIRGNRQEHPSNPGYKGIIEYNDKPSLYSLHRVWKLRYRDFSKNATQTAEIYNEDGLPLRLSESTEGYFQPFLNAVPGANIEYISD